MKQLLCTIVLLLASFVVAAQARSHAALSPSSAPHPLPGGYQWVPTMFTDLPSAAAALAAGASDPLPPLFVTTSDALVPYVVLRWEFADLTARFPNFEFFAGDELTAYVFAVNSQSVPGMRHRGLVSTGNSSAAVGWYTHD